LSTIEIVRGGKDSHELNVALGDFASHLIFGVPGQFANFTTLGFLRNNEVVAGVVFHNWYPQYGTVEISAASTDKRWLNRTTIKVILSEAFHVKQCQTVFARMEPDVPHARIFEAIGFVRTILPQMRGKGKDELLFTLTEADWLSGRWS
jgi:hypothetical protein